VFNSEAVMSADLHDQRHMTASITLIGENGIERPDSKKMLHQESVTMDTTRKSSAIAALWWKVLDHNEKIANLAAESPALFYHFAESSD